MTVQVISKNDALVIEFADDLTIFSVKDSYEALKKTSMVQEVKVILDLSAVNDFDSSGMQLLMWFMHQNQDKKVCIKCGENPAVNHVFQMYSLNIDTETQPA